MSVNHTELLPDIRDDTPPAHEIEKLREQSALLTRQRDALQDELDLLREHLVSVQERYDEAIEQWRQRCEACHDAQLELAALLSDRPPSTASDDVPDAVRQIIAQKDAYILHLETLLKGSP